MKTRKRGLKKRFFSVSLFLSFFFLLFLYSFFFSPSSSLSLSPPPLQNFNSLFPSSYRDRDKDKSRVRKIKVRRISSSFSLFSLSSFSFVSALSSSGQIFRSRGIIKAFFSFSSLFIERNRDRNRDRYLANQFADIYKKKTIMPNSSSPFVSFSSSSSFSSISSTSISSSHKENEKSEIQTNMDTATRIDKTNEKGEVKEKGKENEDKKGKEKYNEEDYEQEPNEINEVKNKFTNKKEYREQKLKMKENQRKTIDNSTKGHKNNTKKPNKAAKKGSPSEKLIGSPIRILALHGYLQHAELFYNKTGSLRKGLKNIDIQRDIEGEQLEKLGANHPHLTDLPPIKDLTTSVTRNLTTNSTNRFRITVQHPVEIIYVDAPYRIDILSDHSQTHTNTLLVNPSPLLVTPPATSSHQAMRATSSSPPPPSSSPLSSSSSSSSSSLSSSSKDKVEKEDGGDESYAKKAGGVREGGRSWWTWEQDDNTARASYASHYKDIHTVTVPYIKEMLKKHYPIHGMFGFSQGATATAITLASLEEDSRKENKEKGKEQERKQNDPDIISALSFVILCGGFIPRDESILAYLDQYSPNKDTLFIMGENDELVPPSKSLELKAKFRGHGEERGEEGDEEGTEDVDKGTSVSLFYHNGKHMVPTCSGATKEMLKTFIEKKIKK